MAAPLQAAQLVRQEMTVKRNTKERQIDRQINIMTTAKMLHSTLSPKGVIHTLQYISFADNII